MIKALFINDLDIKGVSLYSKLVTLVLLLESVLNIYGTTALSYSVIFQVVCIVIYIIASFAKSIKITFHFSNLPRWIIVYFIYLTAIYLFMEFSIPIGYIRMFLWYIVFFNVIDIRYLIKSYQSLAVFIIGFFYLQEVTHLITGVRVLGFIQGLPLRLAAADDIGFLTNISTNTRSSSIFSEPAHLAQWLFPLLCLRLFSRKYYNVKRAVIIIFTLLLTKSGNAMFGLSAIGLFYIYNLFKTNKLSSKIKAVFVLIIGVGAFVVYSNSSIGAEVMSRQETLSVTNEMDKGYATSSFMRIYRGYFIYADYDVKEKIFGNPSEEAFWQHAHNSGILSLFKENDTYMNTVHRILIYTGFIGIVIIIMLTINLWRNNVTIAKVLLFIWLVFSFISSGFFTGYTSIYLAFIYFMKKQKFIC